MADVIRLGDVHRNLEAGLTPAEAARGLQKVSLIEGDHASVAEAILERARAGSPAPVVHAEGRWWRYCPERGYWAELPRHQLEYEIVTLAQWAEWQPLNQTKRAYAPRMTANLKSSVYSLAKTLAGTQPDLFAKGMAGLCFRNGFLEVHEGGASLQPHRFDQYARHQLDFDWDPEAGYGEWEAFLDDVWSYAEDRDERKQFLAEFLGAALVGHATVHNRVCLLLGTGANGKSVLCDVVHGLFPPSAVVSIPPHDLGKEAYLARLVGAQMNLVSDIPGSDLMDSGVFKQVTSGDQVTARRLHENPFEFSPRAGHLFSANRLPISNDHTAGFYRRWVVLRFERRFDGSISKDALVHRLQGNYPGIMRWAVEGAIRAMRRPGYLIPTDSRATIEEWQQLSDQVRSFVESRCIVLRERDYRRALPRKAVYDAFKAWAQENQHGRMSAATFYRRLEEIGVEAYQQPHNKPSDYKPKTRMVGLAWQSYDEQMAKR